MSSAITLIEGLAAVNQLRFASATALDGTYRIAHTSTDTTLTAIDEISFTAPTVNVPGAVFTSAGATLAKVSVAGASNFAGGLAAVDVVADRVVTNLFEAVNPANDTITVTANKIQLNADIEITGSLDSVNRRDLLIKDKILTLGANDPNGDGTVDVDDTNRDGAGIVIPGAPANMPNGTDATLYEHSMKWRLNSGDFASNGDAIAPHLKPTWTFKGGALAITGPDSQARKARFFFAPYYTANVASLGLYYGVGSDVKLVQTFAAPAVPVPVSSRFTSADLLSMTKFNFPYPEAGTPTFTSTGANEVTIAMSGNGSLNRYRLLSYTAGSTATFSFNIRFYSFTSLNAAIRPFTSVSPSPLLTAGQPFVFFKSGATGTDFEPTAGVTYRYVANLGSSSSYTLTNVQTSAVVRSGSLPGSSFAGIMFFSLNDTPTTFVVSNIAFE